MPFRKLAKKFHPDQNKDNPKAKEKFAEANAAYEIIGRQGKTRASLTAGEIDAEGKEKFQGFGGRQPVRRLRCRHGRRRIFRRRRHSEPNVRWHGRRHGRPFGSRARHGGGSLRPDGRTAVPAATRRTSQGRRPQDQSHRTPERSGSGQGTVAPCARQDSQCHHSAGTGGWPGDPAQGPGRHRAGRRGRCRW